MRGEVEFKVKPLRGGKSSLQLGQEKELSGLEDKSIITIFPRKLEVQKSE